MIELVQARGCLVPTIEFEGPLATRLGASEMAGPYIQLLESIFVVTGIFLYLRSHLTVTLYVSFIYVLNL